jgi:hypothetical protein
VILVDIVNKGNANAPEAAHEKDGAEACRVLDTCLKPGGIIIEVSQQDREAGRPKFFHRWDKILGACFEIAHRERFDDPERPYEIVGYRRRAG